MVNIDPARFILEFVRAEPFDSAQDRPVEAQPFDRLRANGTHVLFVPDQ
jgi:hypothetical protein